MSNVCKKFITAAAIFSLAMLFSTPVLAQTTGHDSSVTGVITVISGTTLTLRGDTGGLYTVLVPSARFESDDGYHLLSRDYESAIAFAHLVHLPEMEQVLP